MLSKAVFTLGLFLFSQNTLFAAPTPVAAPSLGGSDVVFVAELINGKKSWYTIPQDASFAKGATVKAKIINLMVEPHGFEIKGIVAPMVIQTGTQELTFTIPKDKAGPQSVSCQLHPAHLPSKFNVK